MNKYSPHSIHVFFFILITIIISVGQSYSCVCGKDEVMDELQSQSGYTTE